MCGIAGEVNFKSPLEAGGERVRSMIGLLRHRGPDGHGVWAEPGICLGHRRLSIIDTSDAAAQPMHSPDGRHTIVFNGEIYNFLELKKELAALGETFQSRSDTEVLLRALAVWGLDALRRLNGMWAFALWDRVEKSLILCRDDLGIKPLYWAQTAGGAVFASEIHPLFQHPEVSREINLRSLSEQVACRYVLAPRTLFRGVRKLPPGHFLKLSAGDIRIEQYYRLPSGNLIKNMTEDDAVRGFSRLFEGSVKRRLISDVPLGLLLSGGIDSTAVAAAMKKAECPKIESFTVGFSADGKYDERQWAKVAARTVGTEHHELLITPQIFSDGLEGVLGRLDDPVADMAVLPLFFVCRMARERVKVLLTGQGADEILGGYHLDRALRQIRAIIRLRKMPGARPIASAYAKMDRRRAYLSRWEEIRVADPGQLPGKMRYDLTSPLSPSEMALLLKEPAYEPYDPILDAFYTEIPSHRGPLDAILLTLCKGWLPDNLLNHSDRMSMAHGVEMRIPFLDPELIDFCLTLPEHYKVRGSSTKYLLKRYLELEGFAHNLVHRKKRGFPVPWDDWIRGPLKATVTEALRGAKWMGRYFHRGGIEKVLEEHSGGCDRGLLLWNLTVLARWGEENQVS